MTQNDPSPPLMGDQPLLKWFDGRYARCFVALHPFFKVPGLDPALCQHGPVINDASELPADIPFLDWSEAKADEALKDKVLGSAGVELAARLYGEPIGWGEICREAGFSDHLELNVGLLSSILALRGQYYNESHMTRVRDYCRKNAIFMPTSDVFQVLMYHRICALLGAREDDRHIMRDEFGFAEEVVTLAYLKECGIRPTGSTPDAYKPVWLSTEDERLALSVEFDCFFTLIFEQDETLPRQKIEALFEGFWCAQDTKINWWESSKQPLVGSTN